ncbi:hypothetical protein [Pseudoalteromonas piscicida]|uniref:Fibronectin type-III domain-containing protein n=1 Tax=Pseudoalteromonas piscicida TaxID=43662 RepID=A0A2A5JLY0_PSEO7|nr:hypothetical protein [Pseudoalteromonas piscicida]PCK30464.1 hypothetical protein CEX98_17740 [Pseudoalteromonas piscicida]
MSKVVDVVGDVVGGVWDFTVGALFGGLMPDATQPEQDVATLAKGLQKGIDQPRRITFGRDRVGGVIAHQATVTRGEKEFIQLIVLINGAPIDALENVYIANKPISDYPAGSYDYAVADGRHSHAIQLAVQRMKGWTVKHIGRDQAHIFLELENNREVFPDGVSDCEFLIRGARVWDPRDASQDPDDRNTWKWSQNAVLCTLHYVRFYGANQVPVSHLPMNWWIAAANVCDEEAEYTDSQGETHKEPRYTVNGTFAFTSRPLEVLQQLERSFAGKVFRQMGQWYVRVGAWYGAPTYTVTMADVLGDVKIKWHADLRERANTVRAQFVDPKQNYERTDAPPVIAQSYLEQDAQPLEQTLSLPFVRSSATAQRLAAIQLEQTRLGAIELPLRHTGLRAAVGRTIKVDIPEYHINNKIYRVIDRRFRLDRGVTIRCIEDGPGLWADGMVPGVEDLTPNTDYVPGIPLSIESLNVSLDADGNGVISWSHPAPDAVYAYDVEIDDGENQAYKAAVTYPALTLPTFNMGNYTVRIFARNIYGKRSAAVATQFSVLKPVKPQVNITSDYNQLTLTASLPAVGVGTQYQWMYLGTDGDPQQSEMVYAQTYNRIGLSPETEYKFKVRTVNLMGESDWLVVTAQTSSVNLSEFVNDLPLTKLSEDAQTLIRDIDKQVDRLRPSTEQNLPSLIARNIDQIQSLQNVTAILDDSLAVGLPNQLRTVNIKLDETVLTLTDMQRAVFDVTGNYTSFRQEYERKMLDNERLIDAIVYVDPDSGVIVNRAYQYTDNQFSLAQTHINGVDGRVSFEARRITQTQSQLNEATAQIMVQAGLINQRATYTEVNAQIAGAIAALTPAYSWQFNTSAEGFTGHSSHNVLGFVVCSHTLNSPAIEYSASQNPMFRLRVRRHPESTWAGEIHFGGVHAIPVPEPNSLDWEIIQIDATGTPGYTGTITALTFELGGCDVDYIEVGKRGANDLALRDITARTTTIEQELDAGTGRMAQYATTAWTNAQGYQTQSNVQAALDSFNSTYGISAALQELADNDVIVKANSAQTWIDGANATIKNQVTQLLNEDEGVNQKLALAEHQLDAIAGEMGQAITQIQGLELEAAGKSLSDLMTEYNTLLRNNELAELGVTVAHANSKLSALSDNVSAVVEQTTHLIAMQNQNVAGVTALGRAYANERQASAEREQHLRAEITTESGKAVAKAIDFTRAATGYCVDADGNHVDEQNAVACEAAGHNWIDGPVVERSMMLATAMVDARGYQTSSQVSSTINTFNAQYGITTVLQTLSDNNTLEKANAASTWIAAADGYIRDQINIYNNADGGINDQFAQVDQTLDAIAGEISRNIVQIRGRQLADDAQSLNEVIAAYNQLVQGNDLAQQNVKLSVAQDKLNAVTDELASTASYALELGALHNQNQAYITTLAKAFANEVRASVTRDERFAVFVGNTEAAFSDVTEAFAEVNHANIVRDQTFSAFAANTEAAFQTVTEALADQEQALAKQRTDLVAKIEQDNTATLASAITYTRAAVGYCIDDDGNITNETDAVQCVTAGHSWVDGPLAEYIRNLSLTNAADESVSISDIRQAFETQNGELIARGGWVINNEGRIVSIAGYNDGDVGSIDLAADIIRQGVMIGNTFVPTSYVDNADPEKPVHVFRGRLVLGNYVVESEQDIRGLDGERGPQGIPGEPGADGKSSYTWIKYAYSPSGEGISNYPDGRDYIGIAYNKLSSLESSNPADYTWTKYKGAQGPSGADGLPGEPGQDGQTLYTWIAYSDSPSGNPLYQTPTDATQYIGIAVNQATPSESNDPTDYIWSKFRGDRGSKGESGRQGDPGSRGAGKFQIGTSSGTWYDSIANGCCTGGSPVLNDVVTIYKVSDPAHQTTKLWNGSNWEQTSLHIHGSALIDGTVIANGVVAAKGTIDSITAVSGHVKINNDGIEAIKVSSNAQFVTPPGASAANNPSAMRINSNSGISGSMYIYNPNSSGYGASIYAKGTYALYSQRGIIGPFTGGHEGLIDKSIQIEAGDLVKDIELVNIADLSNAICTMEPTTQPNDRAVRGIFISRTDLTNQIAALRGYRGFERFIEFRDTHDLISFNALGEGVLNICGHGGDIETGDYLCSSAMRGKAMRQADQNFERPYTIAQARHPITFTHPDQVKQAAVIYLRG